MGCLMKTLILILAIFGLSVVLYLAGVPQKLVGVSICQFMKHKQGLDAQVGSVEFTKLGEMSIKELKVTAPDGKTNMIDLPQVDIGLSLTKVRAGMSAADRIHIEGGSIRADLVGKLFRQKRREGGGGGSSEGGEKPKPQPTPKKGKRSISFKGLTLLGGTRTVNLILVKKKIKMKVQDIEGEMMADGPKVTIKRLKWRLLGSIRPEINDVEMNMDDIRNGRAIEHLPREVKGLILTIWILMGGRPDAALQAK